MRNKVTLILLGVAALGGLGFIVNRISTQLHPYGNWVLVVIVIVAAAVLGAWVWNQVEEDNS